MADNIAITAGSGTAIAADDISSVFYQRVKLGLGADGTAVDAVGGSGVTGTGVQRVVLATDVALPAGTNALGTVKVTNNAGTVIDPVAAVAGGVPVMNAGYEYETVAASQTNQVMGATGAVGDYLSHVIVSPGTSSCGAVTIYDNATALVSFPGGGTTALSNLIPFVIPVGIVSTSGAFKITTGANVTCVGVGNFT